MWIPNYSTHIGNNNPITKALKKWKEAAIEFPFTVKISAQYVQVIVPEVSLNIKQKMYIRDIVKIEEKRGTFSSSRSCLFTQVIIPKKFYLFLNNVMNLKLYIIYIFTNRY